MYRKVATEIWTDPKFRALPAPGKLMFMYLFTNSHTHVGGLYYIPDTLIVRETGLKQEAIDTLWDTLSKSGMTFRDKENDIVWVVNMLRWQAKGEKILRAVSNHLKTLHNSIFIPQFLEKYPAVKRFFRVRVSDTLSTTKSIVSQGGKQEQDITSPYGEVSPTSEVQGNGNVNRPKKPKQPSGIHQELFGAFGEVWKAKYGVEYRFTPGKDGKHIQWLLKAVHDDAQDARSVITAYLADADPWLTERKHPLATLVSNFNKYHGKEAVKVPARPALTSARRFE